jgi:phosphoglycolate phosphatase
VHYKSVIWDWNGTLLDDVEVSVGIANEILGEHSLPVLEISHYREIFDFPVTSYWERAGMDLSRVDFERLSERFCNRFDELVHSIPLFDSALAILDESARRGAMQFVLSATEQSALYAMLAQKNLGHHFTDIRGRKDRLAHSKVDVGRQMLAEHGIAPEDAVLIGDTLHDAEVARELGVDCVLVSTGHHSLRRLEASGAAVVPSLEGLRRVLWE